MSGGPANSMARATFLVAGNYARETAGGQPVPDNSECAAVPGLAILADFSEEQWPSMDLVAEMLFKELRAHHADAVRPAIVCPPFRRWFGHLPALGRKHWAFNTDRLLNRLCHYP